MNTKGITGFLAMVFILMNVSTIAQNSNEYTVYQKKVHELAEKYYCIINYNTDNPKNLNLNDRIAMEFFTSNVYDAESYNGLQAILIMSKTNEMAISQLENFKTMMDNDLKSAEKLKTDADTIRENEEKARKEKEEQRKKAFETDYGYIVQNIEKNFNKWSTKSEYEKISDYENRMKLQSAHIFDSLCIEYIRRIFKYKKYNINMGTYDAEKEQYNIKFGLWTDRIAEKLENTNFDGYIGDKKYAYVETNFTLKVPIKEAKSVNKNLSLTSYEQIVFYNDNIVFKKIKLKNEYNDKEYGPIILPLTDCNDVIFYANDMTIESKYLNGHSFNYSKYDSNCDWKNCSKYFDSYNDYLTQYNKGVQAIYDVIKYKKEYTEAYNKYIAIFNGYNHNSKYIKQLYDVKYNKNKERFNELLNYAQKAKDAYYGKVFSNDMKKFYNTFVNFYIKGKGKDTFEKEVSRIQLYNTNYKLYANEEDFNKLYNTDTTCCKNDIATRDYVKKYKYNIRNLSNYYRQPDTQNNVAKDYKILITNSIYNYEHGIVSTMETVINGDNAMKKEFEKNGSYFSDTKEFFNSYIGENYKTDLKNKQKQRK